MTSSNTNRSRIGRKEGRRLIAVVILSVATLLNVFYSARTQQYFGRHLSINLGGGECEWTAPVPHNATEKETTTTLLTSYPGSGKRLCWRMLEALTGYQAGDDWDLSLNGLHTPFIKTSYPHPEGVWGWGDSMDQVIMVIRNPRYAIPSYHALRNEIDFSHTWGKSFSHIHDTYTEHPLVQDWEGWRDVRFEKEIDLWCWYIDFWIQDGLRRNDGLNNSVQDPHCIEDLKNCRPKAILQFEKMIASNEAVMIQELDKMSVVLDASSNMDVIAEEARPCVYKRVLDNKEFYNPRRNGNGPSIEERKFTSHQLNVMMSEISNMKEKYTKFFLDVPLAQDLVVILDEYIAELSAEHITVLQYEMCQASSTSGGFKMDPVGGGRGKCDSGYEVTEEQCYDAAHATAEGLVLNFKPDLTAYNWPTTPCGCFVHNDVWINFKDPEYGNCVPHSVSRPVCLECKL